MYTPETPITSHAALPDDVPLVADFHDDRNRLSNYNPRLSRINGVKTPETKFFEIYGSTEGVPSCKYREMTKFMQDIDTNKCFLRGDYTSAKLSKNGRILDSQDPHDIKKTFATLVKNVIITERNLGGRIALREFIPHNLEVRFFIRDGKIHYTHQSQSSLDLPRKMVADIAAEFDKLAWSVDVIRHKNTKNWYCIDMGLDGLYPYTHTEWEAISEHTDPSKSPTQYTNKMPDPNRFSYTN